MAMAMARHVEGHAACSLPVRPVLLALQRRAYRRGEERAWPGSGVRVSGQWEGSGSGVRLSGQWSVVSGQRSVVSGQWSVSVSGLGRGEARAVGRRGREQVVGARLHLFDLSALRREELVLRCGGLQEHQDLDEHVAPEVDIAQL